MSWSMEEAVSYYRTQGAPKDQNALIGLLREIQQEEGGSIPVYTLDVIADAYGIKTSLLQLLIKRIPSLRLGNSHCLELCAGPNCSRHTAIAACAEALAAQKPGRVVLKYVPCMRLCGKGPNIRWDGKLYNQASQTLLRELTKDI